MGWAAAHRDLSDAEKKTKFADLKEPTHHHTRIYGMLVNITNYYYHQGTTADFQEYLDHLATIDDAVVKEVRLSPGQGRITRIGQKGPQLEFDWSPVTSHSGFARGGEKLAPGKKDGTVLRVTLFLKGTVDPRKLKLPEGIQVGDQLKDAWQGESPDSAAPLPRPHQFPRAPKSRARPGS
jgi:hypothetical protein